MLKTQFCCPPLCDLEQVSFPLCVFGSSHCNFRAFDGAPSCAPDTEDEPPASLCLGHAHPDGRQGLPCLLTHPAPT